MKKGKGKGGGSRMITAATVEEYFRKVPASFRGALGKVRDTIRKAAPAEAEETMSYGMPAFRYNGALVCYAAFTDHLSFFPMGGGAVEKFKTQLRDFQTTKGTIRFTLEKPLPAPLIAKIVKFRVAQNKDRVKKKR